MRRNFHLFWINSFALSVLRWLRVIVMRSLMLDFTNSFVRRSLRIFSEVGCSAKSL